MACVTDSDEGYRVLTRIFPTPITKKLDISTGSVKFKGISYKMPIVESPQDSELYDNMALVTVFNPLRANWHGFWKSLSLESNNYNCIWNKNMKDCLLQSLQSELDDIQVQKEKGMVSWDYDGYRIVYPQLEEYSCVDGYYLQPMIQAFASQEVAGHTQVELIKPVEFIHHLCDSFIISRDIEEKRALFYLIYQVVKGEEEARQNFPCMRYLCYLLAEEHLDIAIEYYCYHILELVCKKQRNTEQFVDYNGLPCLTVSLMCNIYNLQQNLPPIVIESGSYELPPLSIQQIDRIHSIVHILKNACESMLRIRVHLLKEPILSRLLRCLLLVQDTSVVEEIVSILTLALSSLSKQQSIIYKAGFFRILLLCSCQEQGMSDAIANLLYLYHLEQDTTDIQNRFDLSEKVDSHLLLQSHKNIEQRVDYARTYSYLRFFLPIPMIVLLTREGPSKFKEVFNSETTYTAEYIWDKECRNYLCTQIQDSLSSYYERIHNNPTVDWEYFIPEPIIYEKIDNLLFIHYVFLNFYCEPSQTLPATVDPMGFLSDLITEIYPRLNMLFNIKGTMDSFTYDDIFLILRATLKLIKESKDITKIDKRVFEELGRCLTAGLSYSKNQEMIILALDVILEALQPASYGKPSPNNVCEAVDANLLNSLDIVLEHLTDITFSQNLADDNHPLTHIFTKSLACIRIFATKSIPHALETLIMNSSFIHHLIHFIELEFVEIHPAISLQVLQSFELFLHDEKLLEISVNCGVLIFCLYIAICYDGQTSCDITTIETAVQCIELIAGIGITFIPPKTVMDALTQLVTPGLIKSLRNHTFLQDIRTESICNPILIWNSEMAQVLITLLEDEIDHILDSTSSTGAYWNASAFCHPDSYLHVYNNLLDEIIVDDVFLNSFMEQADFELTDPTPEHFLKALLTYVIQLESTQEVGLRESKSIFLERLAICLKSIFLLLQYHNDLNTCFINDTNIRRLFTLLKDTTIGSDLQSYILNLLEIGVDTPNGCNILAPFIPDLSAVLLNSDSEIQDYILDILTKFITSGNQEVIHFIMSSSIILKLLDMFLQYENEYDGNIQEKAVHILGLMMKTTNGTIVADYLSALFYPLFNRDNEKYNILLSCDDYPTKFIDTVNSDCYSPTIYWNSNTRQDLVNFLQKEARSMNTSDAAYNYDATEITKRFKNMRLTVNQQLVVVNIFIYQFIDDPLCNVDPSLFIHGIIDELSTRISSLKNGKKERNDFAALVRALILFLKGNTQIQDPSLYTSILSLYIHMIRSNIEVAQDDIISTVEFLAKQNAGLVEFKRNNDTVTERSYIVDLLASSYLIANQHNLAYRIADIILNVINLDNSLLNSCYLAGGLFYAFYFVFSDTTIIDNKDSLSHIYLKIIQQLVRGIPSAETDALEFTTSRFKGHFNDDPSIFKAFLRKSQEDTVEGTETIRVWSDSSREAIRKTIEDLIMKMNVETYMNEKWDRKTMRSSMEEISKTWKLYTKSIEVERKFTEECTEIKKRRTTIARPSYAPPTPNQGRERIDSN